MTDTGTAREGMTHPKKYLFVGGPVDGQLFDIGSRRQVVYMPISVPRRPDESYIPTIPKMDDVKYRIMAFTGERARFELYSCVSADDVLAKLISYYGER